MSDQILNQIFETIEKRKEADPSESYVASLYAKGTEKIAQKVGEEAVETVIEAIKSDRDKVTSESADLLFHLMVLWANQGVTPNDVLSELAKRQGISGHEEKASRKS